MPLKYRVLTSALLLAACSTPEPSHNLGSRQHASVDESRPWVLFGHYFPSGSKRNLTNQEADLFRRILGDAKNKDTPPSEHSPILNFAACTWTAGTTISSARVKQ